MQQNSLAEIVKRENLNYYEFNHPSITEEEYGEDYFERGFEKGISCFSMYRWLPELTTPMAMAMVDHLGIRRQDKILDFGSSKEYLVISLTYCIFRYIAFQSLSITHQYKIFSCLLIPRWSTIAIAIGVVNSGNHLYIEKQEMPFSNPLSK